MISNAQMRMTDRTRDGRALGANVKRAGENSVPTPIAISISTQPHLVSAREAAV